MDAELGALERKLEDLLRHYAQLRAENADLRAQLNSLRKEHDRITLRMNEAAQRLDTLLENLPEENA